ncbi:serine palmitoyltransferase [Lactarius deliciosus]|nr:serine palmitoyltransferase [Lactarius deliciosus]
MLRTQDEQIDLASAPVVSGASGPWPKLANTGKQVLHLASYDFTGLAGNETSKVRAIEALWKYGVGSCGPLGFYGTIGASMDLERSIADFLGTDASIPYLQGFSTISCVVSAFAKRGDIIIADRGINFVVQKGLETSHSTGRCFNHNDLRSLEDLFLSVEKECRKRFGPLTRRFIVPEGIFEKGCTMIDLPKLVQVSPRSFESISISTVGIAMGGQRINRISFVFSAMIPAVLAVPASEGINILPNTPSFPSTQENPTNPVIPAPRDAPSFDKAGEERLLRNIIDKALAQGELVEVRPSIRLAITTALLRKECVIKFGVANVLAKRK